MTRRAGTSTLPRRTRARTISRSFPRISIPTPEPIAISFRSSFEMSNDCGIGRSVHKRGVVPAEEVNRGIEARGHVFEHRRDGTLEVGELAIGQANPAGGADVQ